MTRPHPLRFSVAFVQTKFFFYLFAKPSESENPHLSQPDLRMSKGAAWNAFETIRVVRPADPFTHSHWISMHTYRLSGPYAPRSYVT